MERKAGIYLVRNDGKILIGHPTGNNSKNGNIDFWSIPKGKIEEEEGETPWETAMRETYEESNVEFRDVELDKVYELPSVKYTSGKKRLYPFVVMECNNQIEFWELDIKCNSFVPEDSKRNPNRPEFDEFKWVSFDEAEKELHTSQQGSIELIRKIFKDCNEDRED